MILRKFNNDDIEALRNNADGYEWLTDGEIKERIHSFGVGQFGGRYFRIYAVDEDDVVVGMITMVQRGEKTIHIRPETFPRYRRMGFAERAMKTALWHVKNKLGYKVAIAQVDRENEPLSSLYIKLGYTADHTYINKKGKETIYFIKAL